MTPETEALCKRLEAVESDPIGAGLSNNRYRNPDGPEAAAKLREMAAALKEIATTQREQFNNPNEHGLWCINRARAARVTAALGGSHG